MIPDDWQQHVPLPIVVGLHANNTSPDRFASLTEIHHQPLLNRGPCTGNVAGPSTDVPLAKFITVYPGGPQVQRDGQTWNNQLVYGAQLAASYDDIGFIQDVLQRVVNRLQPPLDAWRALRDEDPTPVYDDARVFITGFSGGALMVYRVARDNGGTFRFAAAAMMATSIGGAMHSGDVIPPVSDPIEGVTSNQSPQFSALPEALGIHLLHMHGAKDEAMPLPAGGDVGSFSGTQIGSYREMGYISTEAQDLARSQFGIAYGLNQWAMFHGGTGTEFNDPTSWPNSGNISFEIGGWEISGILDSSVGHEWPSTATNRVLKFFNTHSL